MSQPTNNPGKVPSRALNSDVVAARAKTAEQPTVTMERPDLTTRETETKSVTVREETTEPSTSTLTREEAARSVTARPKRVRKARLRLARIDPWSVMKTSLLFAVAGGIMFWVATYLVWSAIGSSGLFEAINKMVSGIVNAPGDANQFQIENYISTNKVLGLSALLAVVDIVIFTALATLASFLYNLAATMLGGLEVTLAED